MGLTGIQIFKLLPKTNCFQMRVFNYSVKRINRVGRHAGLAENVQPFLSRAMHHGFRGFLVGRIDICNPVGKGQESRVLQQIASTG